MMIPKIIHYCWFGKQPLPEKAQECIDSWRKFCPDYKIIEWNESNFDFNSCQYAREAYECKKWAFVSDYARFWILYNYGGLYFDTDVELIHDINEIVIEGPFMGSEPSEEKCRVAAGLGLGVYPHHPLYKEILDYYQSLRFIISDHVYNDETIVTYITDIAQKHGYVGDNTIEQIGDISIYPPEFFCPMDMKTGQLHITEKTKSIHWYTASWKDETETRIHNRAVEIYNKYNNAIGRLISEVYESTAKTLYYIRVEGLSSVTRRILRKLSR